MPCPFVLRTVLPALLFLGGVCQAQPPTPTPPTGGEEVLTNRGEWIWSPAYEKDKCPAGACFFRKTIPLRLGAEAAMIHVAADNRYELFVNGASIAAGGDWRKMDTFDITAHMRQGKNVIAIRGENIEQGPAGLVAQVLLRPKGGTIENYSTDATWKTSVQKYRGWNLAEFNDRDWLPAKSYGRLGAVLPWGTEVVVAEEGARFTLDPEFRIARVARNEATGSALAMCFTAEGRLLVSKERGPLMLLSDKDSDGFFESKTVYCDKMNSAQGIASIGGRVFAVGVGPEGPGLYRMTDSNGDSQADECRLVLRFRGSAGEHGAHAVRLGPDGMLYLMVGNFARADAAPNPRSPYQHVYEGDLVKPRYEDPGGHANGVPAPGATVVRTDLAGRSVEIFAAGLRNPYDLAFNEAGELFTFDADMEWDLGTPWYRPTRINHLPAGGEFGWRSGWAKWPEYWLDSLPAALNIGGGSPTGVEFYEHKAFPARYQNTLFAADWSQGKIYALKLQRSGGGYRASASVFLRGRPMAVTDLAVGPDGALYFCTGGRGTEGGVYRVSWKGKAPPEATDFGRGIDRALRQPQYLSDWGRSKIEQVRQELAGTWAPSLLQAAANPERPTNERRRALQLMMLYGPAPSEELMQRLANDTDAEMRTATARFLGRLPGESSSRLLLSMLGDQSASVRRTACESLAALVPAQGATELIGRLGDEDRYVRFAARRALEKIDRNAWREAVLGAVSNRAFLEGSVALLAASPDRESALKIATRCEQMLRGRLNQRDFLDLLRVMQLALERSEIDPGEMASLGRQLLAEYPTSDARMNRELVRLLVYLQEPGAAGLMAAQLEADIDPVEKLHIAAYASRLGAGWQTPEKLALLRYYETVRGAEGGFSVPKYVEAFARNFFTNLTLEERRQVLAAGERYPTSALSVLAKLPDQPGAELLAQLRDLDARLEGTENNDLARLRVGIVAVLAKSNEPESVRYLHQVYADSPGRRSPVAMALTQHPEAPNWAILIDALRTLEGEPAREVLAALGRVRVRPREATPYRNVILQGLRPEGAGAESADRLLAFWMGQAPGGEGGRSADERIKAWQSWYAKTFPNEPPADPPRSAIPNRWSYEELRSYLESPSGRSGDPALGRVAFEKATCIKCHVFAGRGERTGPDLTTVARRFQRKEILESIVFPSHIVSDQYASKQVVADGRTYLGIAVVDGDGRVVVLTKDAKRVELDRDAIESVTEVKASSMPEGLLNPLSLEEVADLFAYLLSPPPQNAEQPANAGGRR